MSEQGVVVGPLAGTKIIEFAGIGPAPFCGMLLADMGAEVLRVDRPGPPPPGNPVSGRTDLLARGRRSAAIDLKRQEGVEVAHRLVEQADALIEGFRPGVMERLGLGPEPCLARNPALVYGRMTGFGQEGPLAHAAGHDINFIALAGALEPIGRAGGGPVPPLNLVGDFGGGGVFLALGIVAAMLEATRSGRGQVVDAAMIDGSSILMTLTYAMREAGLPTGPRGTTLLDSGAPFYDAYETADGKFVAVGAIEPQFYGELLARIEVDAADLPPQMDRPSWPETKKKLAAVFRSRTRDEWCRLLEGTDACFAPVLAPDEAPEHPHHRFRDAFIEVDGIRQPAPAPRFARTRSTVNRPPPEVGEHTNEALADWGFNETEIAALGTAGAIRGDENG